MKTQDALKLSIDMGKMVCMAYLDDLSDEEFMQRPHPECNHINWQVGHLIAAEHQMINSVCPDAMPALPEGFVEKYGKDQAKSDNPEDFVRKDELMEVFNQQRTACLGALEWLTDEQLSQETPESMRSFAPTVASVFSMQGSHWLMHAGQWVIVRRNIGKPIVI